MRILRRAAYPMLAAMFVVGGVDSVMHAEGKVKLAEKVTRPLTRQVRVLPNDTELLVKLNGAMQVIAGILLGIGKLPLPCVPGSDRLDSADDSGRPSVLGGARRVQEGSAAGPFTEESRPLVTHSRRSELAVAGRWTVAPPKDAGYLSSEWDFGHRRLLVGVLERSPPRGRVCR